MTLSIVRIKFAHSTHSIDSSEENAQSGFPQHPARKWFVSFEGDLDRKS